MTGLDNNIIMACFLRKVLCTLPPTADMSSFEKREGLFCLKALFRINGISRHRASSPCLL